MNIPVINSQVVVTVRFRDINYFADKPYKLLTLTGKVVKSQKWVKADSFSLETTDKEYPVKIIPASWVTDIKIISGKVDTVNEYIVMGSKGDKYIVRMVYNVLQCSCTGYKYHGKCKHADQIQKELK
jgi:hypothetical protein